MHSPSCADTGPSRTRTTWSGRRVWSWTALRKASWTNLGWSLAWTGRSSENGTCVLTDSSSTKVMGQPTPGRRGESMVPRRRPAPRTQPSVHRARREEAVEDVQRRHPSGSEPGSAASTTAVLHIGAPKTGTTFVQQVLWHNRARLAEKGVDYPFTGPREHFAATMDLR